MQLVAIYKCYVSMPLSFDWLRLSTKAIVIMIIGEPNSTAKPFLLLSATGSQHTGLFGVVVTTVGAEDLKMKDKEKDLSSKDMDKDFSSEDKDKNMQIGPRGSSRTRTFLEDPWVRLGSGIGFGPV